MKLYRFAGAAVLALGLAAGGVRAAEDAPAGEGKEIKGVLIDQMCGDKMMKKEDAQAAAAGHPKSCAIKCSKDGGAMAIISGGKMLKLDDKSADMARAYLGKEDSTTQVVAQGKEADGKLTISSIKAAPKEEKKDEKKEG
jgi:hypothetical protein